MGEFNLAELGTNDLETEHTVQVTDTQIFGAHVINETRFQYVHDNSLMTPIQHRADDQRWRRLHRQRKWWRSDFPISRIGYELQNITYINRGKHAWKIGGRLRSTDDTNSTAANFMGVYSFGSRLQPGCIPVIPGDCQITPIVAYQITEEGLANGLAFPQIQAMGGGASYYTQTAGTPASSVTLIDGGVFVLDDWKVRQKCYRQLWFAL